MSSNQSIVIDVNGLTKSFDGKVVVNNISLSVSQGEIFGFLGPNGSGKTTFIRMLCGLLVPDSGRGTCLGLDVQKDSLLIKKLVGYMTQKFSYYEDLSVEENLLFVARVYELENPQKSVTAMMERMGLVSRRKQLAGTLSGGWKQRLSLAACLLHEPKLLLLDEPTAGVDPKARREFWDAVHEFSREGLTTLVTTHYMDEAERCSRLGYIAYGNLLTEGTAQEIVAHSELSTFEVKGDIGTKAVSYLRSCAGVEFVVPFGNTLHVSARKVQAIDEAKKNAPVSIEWNQISPTLEDVFIALMKQGQDNF